MLSASGAWLWWNYRPDRDQWVRVVHQVAAVGLLIVAVGLLVLAILRRQQLRRSWCRRGGRRVLVTVGAAYVIGRLLPWDSLALHAVTTGDGLAGVGAAFGSEVAVVAIDGRAVSPATYEAWAYAHLALSALVVLALVMVGLRSRDRAVVRSS